MNAPLRILDISASALAKVIQREVSLSIKNAVKGGDLLRVRGRLGPVKEGNYQKAYGVRLSEAGEEVLADIPKELVLRHGLKGGESVVATGMLVGHCSRFTGNRVEVHLDVTDIEIAGRAEESPQDRHELLTLERLKGLGVRRQPFPAGQLIRLSLVVSRSGHSQVDQDFLLELQSLGNVVQLERIPVNILSAQDIAGGIAKASGNVVAVIRGGGSAEQFDVFEDWAVVEALAAKQAYRVIGLGHTANTTLLDLVADYAATTPTRAGAHIREMVEGHAKTVQEIGRRLGQARDDEIRALQTKLKKSSASPFGVAVGFAAGAIVMAIIAAVF